jgi:hypothetical protein
MKEKLHNLEYAKETMKEFKMPETCPIAASGIF